ncbi:DinB/UmuC family translesion DNA polymerase [Blautia glucerasea]
MMYNTYGIRTIGELARTDPSFLERQLGKMGLVIYSFANGWDDSPVSAEGYQAPIKSIGNSTTTPRDLENDQDVQIILMALAESVAARLRKHGFKCNVVSISIRDNGLFHFSRQRKLQDSTDITDEIMSAAYQLFRENYHWPRPIRSLGIRADDLVMGQVPVQLDLFMNEQRREKQEKLDRAVDDIRRRFGYHSVQRAFMYQDKILSSLDAQGFHTVHPVGYFNGR